MLCEMCGNDVETTSRVRVEGTILALCPPCSKFGTIVDPPPAAAPVATRSATPSPTKAPGPFPMRAYPVMH